MRFGASWSMSNKLLLISRHIMTTGLKKWLQSWQCKIRKFTVNAFHCEESTHGKQKQPRDLNNAGQKSRELTTPPESPNSHILPICGKNKCVTSFIAASSADQVPKHGTDTHTHSHTHTHILLDLYHNLHYFGGLGHLHLSATGTSFSTLSICAPQPATNTSSPSSSSSNTKQRWSWNYLNFIQY